MRYALLNHISSYGFNLVIHWSSSFLYTNILFSLSRNQLAYLRRLRNNSYRINLQAAETEDDFTFIYNNIRKSTIAYHSVGWWYIHLVKAGWFNN